MTSLKINWKNIVSNYKKVKDMAIRNSLELVVITKLFDSKYSFIKKIFKNDNQISVGDCYIKNFVKLPKEINKMLLLTRLSDINHNLNSCNTLLVSDITVLEAISGLQLSKNIEIILSLELGDLRDGINPEDLFSFMTKSLKLKNINIVGIGVNLGCLVGKVPNDKTFNILLDSYYDIKNKLGFEFKKISIGGTVFYDFIESGKIPKEINHIRMGEAIFFGYNMSYQKKIPILQQDTFVFSSEIIEIYEKKIVPEDWEYNAFGEKISSSVKGTRKRAVVDFGRLISETNAIFPKDKNIFIADKLTTILFWILPNLLPHIRSGMI